MNHPWFHKDGMRMLVCASLCCVATAAAPAAEPIVPDSLSAFSSVQDTPSNERVSHSTGHATVDSTSQSSAFHPTGQQFVSEDPNGTGRLFFVSGNFGESIANQNDYYSIGVIQPLSWNADGCGNESLTFFDARFNYQSDGNAGNFGIGQREYVAEWDRIVGGNLFYIVDDTRENTFHQLGLGLEIYNEFHDFRVNGYIPIGDKTQTTGYTLAGPGEAFGAAAGTIALFRHEEAALTGFDVEYGFQLPGTLGSEYDSKIYLGGYHFDANDGDQVAGFMGRVQGRISHNVLMRLTWTQDDFFESSVLLSFVWDISRTLHGFHTGRGRTLGRLNRQPVHWEYPVVTPNRAVELYGP